MSAEPASQPDPAHDRAHDRVDGPGDDVRRAVRPGAAALVFDDPLERRSADDSDQGWGDRPAPAAGGAADLARFLDEKPPHHV